MIHVAGTNGKGSVCHKIARTYEAAGYTVGLYVSPHVSSFRERMQVNGVPISEDNVTLLLPRVYEICRERDIPATFFEITTTLAFSYFKHMGVDVVVLETGLGGRLDATNVVMRPALTVITSIGLEHTRILGDTIEKIAKEKAGIMKKNVPVLCGADVPHNVLRSCGADTEVEGYYTCEDILGNASITIAEKNVGDNLSGSDASIDYDIENSRMVRAALGLIQRIGRGPSLEKNGERMKVTSEHLAVGTSSRPPCRFEECRVFLPVDGNASVYNHNYDKACASVKVILDVAHNPPAVRLLASKLSSTYSNTPYRFVVGFSSDKDLAACSTTILASASNDACRIHLVESAHPRAASIESILESSPALRGYNRGGTKGEINLPVPELPLSVGAQVRAALDIACRNNEILVVCGSVFIMSEAREALGFDEPRDSKYIAEVSGAGTKAGQENFGNAIEEEGEGEIEKRLDTELK